MLKIRLARVGKKKKPTYRFVVSESGRDLYGPSLEILGHYNPFTKVFDVDKDRALFWIGKGAQLSPTVHNMFVDKNVITAPKVTASKAGKKPEAAATSVASAALTTDVAPTPAEPVQAETPAEPAAQ